MRPKRYIICISWGSFSLNIIHQFPSVTSGPTIDLEERLPIANHLVQLGMDGAQNQIAIAPIQRWRACRRRRWWIRRQLYEQYERLMSQLEFENQAAFKNFVRVEHFWIRDDFFQFQNSCHFPIFFFFFTSGPLGQNIGNV